MGRESAQCRRKSSSFCATVQPTVTNRRRIMLLNKALAVRRADAQLPQDIRAALVDSLYLPVAPLAAGAIAGAIVSAMVAFRANDPWLFACCLALWLVGFGRIASAFLYKRQRDATDFRRARRWERIYTAGAWS
ncbi:MAG TPA: hypothetical protein VHN20_15040, partial [Beijerinckiaceae bacterium]|nr:hypothetical protein [Beijerinckiaceae bacterium]